MKLYKNGTVSFLIRLAVFQARRRSCETTPKWHGFLMIKLATFQTSIAARMKLRVVEQRTAEYRILMTLRYIYLKISEPQNFERGDRSRSAGAACREIFFFKIDRIHYSMLDVQCSMFDVHFLINPDG
jgi:hypothetical protein